MLCEQFGDALCMYKWSIHVRIPIIPIPRAVKRGYHRTISHGPRAAAQQIVWMILILNSVDISTGFGNLQKTFFRGISNENWLSNEHVVCWIEKFRYVLGALDEIYKGNRIEKKKKKKKKTENISFFSAYQKLCVVHYSWRQDNESPQRRGGISSNGKHGLNAIGFFSSFWLKKYFHFCITTGHFHIYI